MFASLLWIRCIWCLPCLLFVSAQQQACLNNNDAGIERAFVTTISIEFEDNFDVTFALFFADLLGDDYFTAPDDDNVQQDDYYWWLDDDFYFADDFLPFDDQTFFHLNNQNDQTKATQTTGATKKKKKKTTTMQAAGGRRHLQATMANAAATTTNSATGPTAPAGTTPGGATTVARTTTAAATTPATTTANTPTTVAATTDSTTLPISTTEGTTPLAATTPFIDDFFFDFYDNFSANRETYYNLLRPILTKAYDVAAGAVCTPCRREITNINFVDVENAFDDSDELYIFGKVRLVADVTVTYFGECESGSRLSLFDSYILPFESDIQAFQDKCGSFVLGRNNKESCCACDTCPCSAGGGDVCKRVSMFDFARVLQNELGLFSSPVVLEVDRKDRICSVSPNLPPDAGQDDERVVLAYFGSDDVIFSNDANYTNFFKEFVASYNQVNSVNCFPQRIVNITFGEEFGLDSTRDDINNSTSPVRRRLSFRHRAPATCRSRATCTEIRIDFRCTGRLCPATNQGINCRAYDRRGCFRRRQLESPNEDPDEDEDDLVTRLLQTGSDFQEECECAKTYGEFNRTGRLPTQQEHENTVTAACGRAGGRECDWINEDILFSDLEDLLQCILYGNLLDGCHGGDQCILPSRASPVQRTDHDVWTLFDPDESQMPSEAPSSMPSTSPSAKPSVAPLTGTTAVPTEGPTGPSKSPPTPRPRLRPPGKGPIAKGNQGKGKGNSRVMTVSNVGGNGRFYNSRGYSPRTYLFNKSKASNKNSNIVKQKPMMIVKNNNNNSMTYQRTRPGIAAPANRGMTFAKKKVVKVRTRPWWPKRE